MRPIGQEIVLFIFKNVMHFKSDILGLFREKAKDQEGKA